MAILTREQALAVKDTKIEKVEWCAGGEIYIRALTLDERDEFEAKTIQVRETGEKRFGIRAKLIAMSACDIDGKPMFTEADVAALGRKSTSLEAVFIKCLKLSRLTNKDIKELEGN